MAVQLKSGFLLSLFLVWSILGCQRYLPPPEASPYQNTTLRVACPPSLAELIAIQSRPWQHRQQARVETVAFDPSQEPPQADVWLLQPADLTRYAARQQLRPIPSSLQVRGNAYVWEGLLPGYRQQLLLWDRQAVALPLVGESAICLYRSDLFNADGMGQKFEQWQKQRGLTPVQPLQPPTTWEEFATLAEFFRDQHPSGKAGPSLPALPADDGELDTLFYQVAASYVRRGIPTDEPSGADQLDELFSFHCDQKSGQPRLASPGFVAALQLLARLQQCRLPGRETRPERALLTGQAVLAIAPVRVLLDLQNNPNTRDRIGLTAVPGTHRYFSYTGQPRSVAGGVNRVPYLGGMGWLAAVPVTSTQAEAAFDLLAELTGAIRSAQIALEPRWSGGPTRSEQLLRERWDAFGLDAARTRALRDILERAQLQWHNIKNPVYCLRVPDQAARRAAVVQALESTLLNRADPSQALAEAAQRWQQLDAARGVDQAAADYRISIGLLGK
jgi:multiple sugar transport system substrate-binding protein